MPKSTALLFLLALSPLKAQAEPPAPKESTVSVQGQAEVLADPDQATVRLGVSHNAPTANQAQQHVNEKMQAVVAAVRSLGVPDSAVQTARINLFPTYANSRGRDEGPVVTGYQASNTIAIRLDRLDLVGPVLDAATELGSNEIQGVQFELKDDSQAHLEALAQAVSRAKAKATVMAEALGMKLGRVIELSEATAQIQPLYQEGRMVAMERAAPAPVSPGRVTVSASVTLRCALEK